MVANLQMRFSNAFSWMKAYEVWLGFHLIFFPKLRIENTVALFQIMAFRRRGDRSLSEPMIVICRRIYASLRLSELNRLEPEQNGQCFACDIFQCIFVTGNRYVWDHISLKCVPRVIIDNKAILFQVRAFTCIAWAHNNSLHNYNIINHRETPCILHDMLWCSSSYAELAKEP